MHRVHPQEPGAAPRVGAPALADRRPDRPRRLKGRARRPVRAGLAQVVQVAVGQPRQPLEAPVAEHLEHAPQHLARGRPRHPPQGAVNRRQQADVRVRVLAPERLRRRPAPAVLDLPGPAVPPDQPRHLRPRQPRRLPDVSPQQALRGPPLAVVPEPHQRAPDEGVGRLTVRQLDVQRLAALNEGTNLLQSPYPLGLKCHDHPPMIPNPDPSGSLPAGNPPPVQAHTSLDKALPTFFRRLPLDCAARMTGSMAVQSGPPATSGCETRQARKGATVAAKACAGMRLDRIAARPDLARNRWLASERNPGEVSEWSKEHAWKVCMRQRIEGSNPSLSANNSI